MVLSTRSDQDRDDGYIFALEEKLGSIWTSGNQHAVKVEKDGRYILKEFDDEKTPCEN